MYATRTETTIQFFFSFWPSRAFELVNIEMLKNLIKILACRCFQFYWISFPVQTNTPYTRSTHEKDKISLAPIEILEYKQVLIDVLSQILLNKKSPVYVETKKMSNTSPIS